MTVRNTLLIARLESREYHKVDEKGRKLAHPLPTMFEQYSMHSMHSEKDKTNIPSEDVSRCPL
jgi:hypothetical protein